MNHNASSTQEPPQHFKGKDALGHILEKRSQGSEPHGSEMPNHLSSANDAARQISFLLMLLYVIFYNISLSTQNSLLILALVSVSALIFHAVRSAWLGWTHLERLHRLLEQEKYEIEHHRAQERDELKALYRLKGFEGPLLEQVVDVLMADDERLLKVMLEEEMGLTLGAYEHPLKQSLGAAIGGAIAIIIAFLALFLLPDYGIVFTSLAVMGISGGIAAYSEDNRIISAIIWNVGMGALGTGVAYFLLHSLKAD